MKKLFFLILALSCTGMAHAQSQNEIRELDYQFHWEFTGEVKNNTDSVFSEVAIIEFPEEVEITGISFDESHFEKELAQKGAGKMKTKDKKLVFKKSSDQFKALGEHENMYLMDNEERIYRVKLDKMVPDTSPRNKPGDDPKMIIRKAKSNPNTSKP